MHSPINNAPAEANPPTEIVTSCPVCGSSDSELLFWNFDRLYHLPGKFGVLQCNECELVRLSPRPNSESLGYYYPTDSYYSYSIPTIEVESSEPGPVARLRNKIREVVLLDFGYPTPKLRAWQIVLRPILKRLFFNRATYGWGRRFPNYTNGGYALDIGCGSGFYLNILKKQGWKVLGVELNAESAEIARKYFDIDVFVGKIEDLPVPDRQFDFINMSHVLEHFPDPLSTMRAIRDRLRVGGTIYIEVPNFGSYSRRKNGDVWYAWETPRHLFTFSPKNLAMLVNLAGLSVTRLCTMNASLHNWDITFHKEKMLGHMLDQRPVRGFWNETTVTIRRIKSQLNLRRKRDEGDFICCWVTKR